MANPQLAVAREKLGKVLKDRWTLEGILGVGGMAAVYLARHRNGMRAAIKLLHGPLSEDAVVRERFLREAYLANSLETKGVVHVLDDDADPTLGPFLVMELLDGESVLDLLERGAKMPLDRTLDLADQTLDVLAIAHERGIVHRDLKPANLFLCADGTVKVLDFGIARILDDNAARLTRTGVPIGTPAYMSPEQARGQGRDVDGRADIYALGATLFRIIAGRHVHVGLGAAQIAMVATTRATRLHDASASADAGVATIVDRALEFEPERRYANARLMQEDVRAVRLGQSPPHASRALPPPPPIPKLGFATPASAAGKRADPGRDLVIRLADEARQRAHAAAKRPDAFRAVIGEPSTARNVNVEATTDPAARLAQETTQDDDDMPTVVGSIPAEVLGRRPDVAPEPSPTPPAHARPVPRAPPSRAAASTRMVEPPTSPRAVPPSVLSGELPTRERTAPTARPAAPTSVRPPAPLKGTIANAFARSPNVPIPSVRPAAVDLADELEPDFRDEATTLSRQVAAERVSHQVYKAIAPPPSSGSLPTTAPSSAPSIPTSMPSTSATRVPSTERAVVPDPIGAPAEKKRVAVWVWIAVGVAALGAAGGTVALLLNR